MKIKEGKKRVSWGKTGAEKAEMLIIFTSYLALQSTVLIYLLSVILFPYLLGDEGLIVNGIVIANEIYLRLFVISFSTIVLLISVPVLFPFYKIFMKGTVTGLVNKVNSGGKESWYNQKGLKHD